MSTDQPTTDPYADLRRSVERLSDRQALVVFAGSATADQLGRLLADAVPLDQPPRSRLVEQLRQQLADEAIEYLDHPDGHDDLPGIYASMCHIRRAIAAAEGNAGGHGEQGDDHG